jgi:5,10-methenyltetrahydromethanopterin hydrogenase
MLYTITVPSTVKSYPVPESVYRTRVLRAMREVCKITGGVTAITSGLGAWIDSAGKLITESVTVIQTYADEAARERLENLARNMARDYSQDAVLFTYAESVPVFVSESVA